MWQKVGGSEGLDFEKCGGLDPSSLTKVYVYDHVEGSFTSDLLRYGASRGRAAPQCNAMHAATHPV